jgi:hypothetical protein
MEESILLHDEKRIDVALETKPLVHVFELIKLHPDVLTLDRLPKLITRCAKDSKAHGEMEEFLEKRYYNHFQKSQSDSDSFWNKDIVLAMIQGQYFTGQYEYDKMICLVKKYGNGLQMGFLQFKDCAYEYEENKLLKLQSCFTQEYIQKCLEEGLYLEVLTLAALRCYSLPILTKQQKRLMRKHLFDVLMVGYSEPNVNSAPTYHKERIKRAKTLFAQCPDLFRFEDTLIVMLSDVDLAMEIYSKMPVGHRHLDQKTIGRLLDDRLLSKPMLYCVYWTPIYTITLDNANIKKVGSWIKKTMASHGHKLHYYQLSGSDRRTLQIFVGLRRRFNITVAFDDFLDVLILAGGNNKTWEEHSITGYSEEKIMKNFFSEYEADLFDLCGYEYRKTITDKRKKKLIFDLFFWKHLPVKILCEEEKVFFNELMNIYVERDPKQVLLIAQKNPRSITLTDDLKLKLLLSLAPQKNGVYASFNFGRTIANKIVMSLQYFQKLLNKIDTLYSLVHLRQIDIADALNKIVPPEKFDQWWAKSVYLLILIEKKKYIPTKEEALELLTVFSNSSVTEIPHNYFICLWKALPNDRKPKPLDLCVLNNTGSVEKPLYDIFRQLLYNNLLVLDEVVIAKLIDLYTKKIHTHYIDHIAKSQIPNASRLLDKINNYKLIDLLG